MPVCGRACGSVVGREVASVMVVWWCGRLGVAAYLAIRIIFGVVTLVTVVAIVVVVVRRVSGTRCKSVILDFPHTTLSSMLIL